MEANMTQRDDVFRDYEPGDEERQGRRYDEGRERDMTTTSEGRQLERQGGGRWKGYVVPYRYYGPGYRGVGYYSVAYLGPEEEQGGTERSPLYGESRRTTQGWGGQGSAMSGVGYAGLGPKGYRRSDERIREDISDRLMASEWLDASEIEVDVSDGEVTLSGTVQDRSAKRLAEDIVEDVMGVREVMNQLRIKGGAERQQPAGRSASGQRSRSETAAQRSSSQGSETNGKRTRTAAR
jgi:osmotically-inducible protein OsmY